MGRGYFELFRNSLDETELSKSDRGILGPVEHNQLPVEALLPVCSV